MLEGFRDHIVSSLHGKSNPYAMGKALMDLFHNNIDHRELEVKDKLRNFKMEEVETVPTYLVKFNQCRYERGSVGVIVAQDDLVSLSLLGLPKYTPPW